MITGVQNVYKNFGLGVIIYMDTKTFITRAREVHGDTYLYERTVHPGTKHCKVTITCPIHGDFEHRADMHLQGNGCKQCADDLRKMTTQTFVRKAREVQGDRFDYSLAEFKGSHERITIVCPLHGPFEQTAYLHLQNHGCRKCKYLHHPSGYTYQLFKENRELATSLGIFYIVEYDFPGEIPFIKIGITIHDAYTRHKSNWSRVTILLEQVMSMEDAFHHEQVLLHRPDIQQFRYTPRNLKAGVTECFTTDVKPFLF
jgi:hypothetical protein